MLIFTNYILPQGIALLIYWEDIFFGFELYLSKRKHFSGVLNILIGFWQEVVKTIGKTFGN